MSQCCVCMCVSVRARCNGGNCSAKTTTAGSRLPFALSLFIFIYIRIYIFLPTLLSPRWSLVIRASVESDTRKKPCDIALEHGDGSSPELSHAKTLWAISSDSLQSDIPKLRSQTKPQRVQFESRNSTLVREGGRNDACFPPVEGP